MKHQQKPVVLYFHPSQPCSICGRASNVGTMDNFTAGLVVHCWEHGLVQFFAEGEKPTQYALQELYASVARFVIAMMNGFGTATVIGPIAYRMYQDGNRQHLARWKNISTALKETRVRGLCAMSMKTHSKWCLRVGRMMKTCFTYTMKNMAS